jgi:hypothetical protein
MAANNAVLGSLAHPAATALPSKGQLWTGRVLHIIVLMFLLFDAVPKILGAEFVLKASAPFGFTRGELMQIGVALLFCTILYVIPRTSVLGAALLTAYLGGAVQAVHHAHMAPFNLCFPILFAVAVWISLWLRIPQLRSVFPLVQRP